jgi:hypothetical protein
MILFVAFTLDIVLLTYLLTYLLTNHRYDRIYADIIKRPSENFLALAASGYYNGTLFHRNMRGFMVQGGDPTSSGKGGESIWGGLIDDEFSSLLKHGMISLHKI